MQTEMVNCVFTHFFGGVGIGGRPILTHEYSSGWITGTFTMVYLDVFAPSLFLVISRGYLSQTSERHMLASQSVSLREQSSLASFAPPGSLPSGCFVPVTPYALFHTSLSFHLRSGLCNYLFIYLIILLCHCILYWCLSSIVCKTITSIKFFKTEIERTGSVTSARVFKRSSRFCIGYIARDLDKPTARHDKLRGNSRPVLREPIGWALRVIRLSYTKGKIL